MFWDQFDDYYCINLKTRQDRWDAVQTQFEKVGLGGRVKRFDAFTGQDKDPFKAGIEGCRRSHVGVVRHAQSLGLKSVVIFEDDVVFQRPPEDIVLPVDWALFYLGFYITEVVWQPFYVDEKAKLLRLLDGCFGLHAYAVNLQHAELFLGGEQRMMNIDSYLISRFQITGLPCYALNPPIAFQSGCKSNLRNLQPLWQEDFVRRWNHFAQQVGAKQATLP